MLLPTDREPTHPGEMLYEEFLKPLELSQTAAAERMGISFVRLNEIVNGRRGITPDTALRLARLFGTTPDFWLNGQLAWDLWHTMHGPGASEIKKIRPLRRRQQA